MRNSCSASLGTRSMASNNPTFDGQIDAVILVQHTSKGTNIKQLCRPLGGPRGSKSRFWGGSQALKDSGTWAVACMAFSMFLEIDMIGWGRNLASAVLHPSKPPTLRMARACNKSPIALSVRWGVPQAMMLIIRMMTTIMK